MNTIESPPTCRCSPTPVSTQVILIAHMLTGAIATAASMESVLLLGQAPTTLNFSITLRINYDQFQGY